MRCVEDVCSFSGRFCQIPSELTTTDEQSSEKKREQIISSSKCSSKAETAPLAVKIL